MLKQMVWLFIVCTLCIQNSSAQRIAHDTVKARILRQVVSRDALERLKGFSDAQYYNIKEVVPQLVQEIWESSSRGLGEDLDMLISLEYPEIYQLCIAIYDSSDRFTNRGVDSWEPLEVKVTLTEYFLKYNDFRTVPALFEYLKRPRGIDDFIATSNLELIARKVPEYREQAISELRRAMNTASIALDRHFAMISLVDVLGSEMIPELVQIVTTDTTEAGENRRRNAVDKLLMLEYPQMNKLLRQLLYSEPVDVYRWEYADTLLMKYGTLSDYIYVLQYFNQLPQSHEKRHMVFSLAAFIPITPTKNTSLINMHDTLISYANQCEAQHWLGDANFAKEISKKIDNAKKHLAKKDSINCYKEVREFQRKVNEVYEDTIEKEKKHEKREKKFVTVVGWKFLYYNAQYIMDRLPHKKNERDDDKGKN